MSTPYTGPTGLVVQDGSMHILGYPDAARVVKLSTPKAWKLASLRLHDVDLKFCESLLGLLMSPNAQGDSPFGEALLIAFLVKLIGCFSSSAGRSRLDPQKAFGDPSIALETFKYYKNLRNKHLVHDENNLNWSTTALVLGERHVVQDVLSLSFKNAIDISDNVNNFKNLLEMAKAYCEVETKKALAEVWKEVNSMKEDAVAKLENLTYTVPTREDIANSRIK